MQFLAQNLHTGSRTQTRGKMNCQYPSTPVTSPSWTMESGFLRGERQKGKWNVTPKTSPKKTHFLHLLQISSSYHFLMRCLLLKMNSKMFSKIICTFVVDAEHGRSTPLSPSPPGAGALLEGFPCLQKPCRPVPGTVRNATEFMLPPVLLGQPLPPRDCGVAGEIAQIPTTRVGRRSPGVPPLDCAPAAQGGLLCFAVSLPCGAPWDHLPKKPFAFTFLSQSLLFEEPNLQLSLVVACSAGVLSGPC